MKFHTFLGKCNVSNQDGEVSPEKKGTYDRFRFQKLS
jgi:hypothetical protein